MHFGHESRAITVLILNEIIPLAIPYHSSPIPMSNAYAKFYWIKGHNYVDSEWNYPTCNSIPLLSDTNVNAKFEENR